ncbi:murein biosynthesis integral membrane protein MurJ [Bacillus sp. OTU530]|uniref:murein biosynthesis integral membrane protein MurJ n=1 Tax=Bacillus sp. OTU530 TaxID=3043862 RepID=UPI00313E5DF4
MSKGVLKAGLALFIISVASKLLGFVREMLVANYYGTSYVADAYYIAQTPSTLAITFSMAISSVFLPLFVKYSSDRKQSFLFANNVLVLFLAAVVAIYIFVMLFTELFVGTLAPGLPAQAESLSILLVKILFPLVFIVIAVQIYTLMLNTFNDYVASAASVLPNNIIIIVYLWIFGDKYGITGVTIVTLVASVIQLFILYLLLRKHNYTIMNTTEVWGVNSKEFILLLLPIIVSSGFNQLNSVVDRILASGISEGAIASLSYAFRLRGIATGIFITPIITLTFPKLARHSHKKDYTQVSELTHKSLFSVFVLLLPLTLIFMFFSKEIIEILLERGNFDSRATEMTSGIFWAYSLGIIAIGFREVTLRAFYSYGDTKTPTYIMIIGSISNVILSYLFIKWFGLTGLGLSSSISFVITALITIVALKKNLSSIWSRPFIQQMLRLTLVTGIVGGTIYYLKYLNLIHFLLMDNKYLKILGLGLYGIFAYLLFILLLVVLKEEEILTLIKKLSKKIKG